MSKSTALEKRDLSMTYARLKAGLPIAQEEAEELSRRMKKIKDREWIALLFAWAIVGLSVAAIFA